MFCSFENLLRIKGEHYVFLRILRDSKFQGYIMFPLCFERVLQVVKSGAPCCVCKKLVLKRSIGAVGFVSKLASVQCITVLQLTGALRTMVMDMLNAHVDILLVKLLVNKVSIRCVLRLTWLPSPHSLKIKA
jgi:hypothetical protein